MRTIICNLVILFGISSCKTQTNIFISKNDKEIISTIIDKSSYPLPLPPPVGSDIMEIPTKIVDSLLQVRMVVAIHPLMESKLDISFKKSIPNEFAENIDLTLQTKRIKNIDGLYSHKKHTILLADTLALKKSKDFSEFDLLFELSRIWYNENQTKAVFEVGISRGKLYGSATIFCLEKVDNQWSIVKIIPTTEW